MNTPKPNIGDIVGYTIYSPAFNKSFFVSHNTAINIYGHVLNRVAIVAWRVKSLNYKKHFKPEICEIKIFKPFDKRLLHIHQK